MLNDQTISPPQHYHEILRRSKETSFNMLSDLQTGSILRTLCASKPNGKILELGTGTGLSLCWIAEGANEGATIISIDNDEKYQLIAREVFVNDPRIKFLCLDANQWLQDYNSLQFDLIFADAWPGKFENLEQALALIKTGGYFLIDDLLAQPNWPEGHQLNVDKLIDHLSQRTDFVHTALNWSTGLMLFTKIS